jgi:hypothetical protein
MNDVQLRLRENDVRRSAPELTTDEFLRLYLESNFPQTAAFPSRDQRERGTMQLDTDAVDYKKKVPSGTSFDRPDRY